MGASKHLLAEREAKEGWALSVLNEFEAVSECEMHGYWTDNLDSGAVQEAIEHAKRNPYGGLSSEQSAQLIQNTLDTIGDECPGCSKNVES